MHITLETDYAVRLVDYLSTAEGIVGAAEVAQATGVPLRFALKILGVLTDKAILVSFKGARGGYRLGKKPEEITLLEVIEAIEGRYLFSRCLNDGFSCGELCRFYNVYHDISETVREKLAKVNFGSIQEATL